MKIFEAIAKAKEFAMKNDIVLEINEKAFIDEDHLDVNDYADDTELMSMEYKGYLVNVYIGSWQAFEEAGKWIDYDIFDKDWELMNDGDNVCLTDDVLEAATDIEFYMKKINIIRKEMKL